MSLTFFFDLKSKDGKALGRWVNNQRSAKHKGSLKLDREIKLVEAGLKWSVLSTNSWQDMMDELRIYVQEKTRDSQQWDGNVPTNYRIKGPSTPIPIPISENEADDDKNLGRWINRQRSLYQAGKLRKDREEELEEIGLKWSVLSTTSWQSMFDTLLEYVHERKLEDPTNEWDGNVPANHKTDDKPPKALGRWVNRQRSAFTKNKLKEEFVDKLEAVGLKWAVHERRPYPYPSTPVLSTTTSNPTIDQLPRLDSAPIPATIPKPDMIPSSHSNSEQSSSKPASTTAMILPTKLLGQDTDESTMPATFSLLATPSYETSISSDPVMATNGRYTLVDPVIIAGDQPSGNEETPPCDTV